MLSRRSVTTLCHWLLTRLVEIQASKRVRYSTRHLRGLCRARSDASSACSLNIKREIQCFVAWSEIFDALNPPLTTSYRAAVRLHSLLTDTVQVNVVDPALWVRSLWRYSSTLHFCSASNLLGW
ncbi:hypothetical protein EDD16DRAFT_1573809 [Pisolithus croceorrhizus]|nr:hypothetical protein EV401DRAFT_2014957 [Pisolithus croceorrhizus]KAI6120956.1 hypothetical protein EDD16DRAFT_1573809 [Pisolithus croceorrhizus]KAI6152785.1 hypothetical protein EDD17DRAFT_1635077 [Pisolithus thermaeus]